jgi:hypothetical protein
MSTDDELRRRLSNAADHAGAGADPTAAAQAVAAKAAQGGHMALRLLGGLGAAGLVAGTVLGLTVLKPSASASPLVSGAEITGLGLAGFDCPNGAVVASLNAGDRVFATGRNDDGSWLAIRDPQHTDRTIWVPAKAAKRDTTTDLAVIPCGTPTPTGVEPTGTTSTTTTVAETTTTATTVAPQTTTKATVPHTVPKTTTTTVVAKLSISVVHPGPNEAPVIYDAKSPNNCPKTYLLSLTTTGPLPVASVVGTYTVPLPGQITFNSTNGRDWTGQFGQVGVNASAPLTPVPVSITAKDAGGSTATVVVNLNYKGTCP